MTTSRVEGETYFQLDNYFYKEQINKTIDPILNQFDRMIKSYAVFNMIFLTVGFLEFFFLVIFFTFLVHSSVLAFSLAIVFLTFFSYFILRLYFQTKKPEQFQALRERYLGGCKSLLGYKEGVADLHIALASACCKLATSLEGREYTYYRPPQWLDILSPTLEKFSAWCHWSDLQRMKEMLLLSSVDEHIKLVKCEPTNLEVHAALANAYVTLSGLYADPRKSEGYEEDRWIPSEKFTQAFEQKFRSTAERAIEEFKILKDYAPDDPWVHMQLAYSYHDLQMPEEEIREYETILKLRPDDKDTLFKLGMLYFQQGKNAHGLRVYEMLKRSNYKKAESLIKLYGTYAPFTE